MARLMKVFMSKMVEGRASWRDWRLVARLVISVGLSRELSRLSFVVYSMDRGSERDG